MPRADHPRYKELLEKRRRRYAVDIGSRERALGRAAGMTLRNHAQQGEVDKIRQLDREDDAAVEATPREFGVTRVRLDAQRATPRPDVAPLGHRLKDRRLPGPDDVRAPVSGYEQHVRLRSARVASGSLPAVQHAELQRLTTSKIEHWGRINGALHEAQGSVLQIEKTDPRAAATIRRVDRAIQAFERHNDRTQIVHANVTVPPDVPARNLAMVDFARKAFPPGRVVTLDQFTQGALNLHEISSDFDERNGVIAIEIRTRRGAYLGSPGDGGRTDFLLPRGIQAQVVDVTRAPYTDPHTKTVKERVVIQLEDLTPEGDQ